MRFLLLLVLACGCGSDGGGREVAVELGTGTVDFEVLPAESVLPIIAGSQGGYHFIVHARARDLEPGDPSTPGLGSNPRTSFSAFSESGEQIDLMAPPLTLGYRQEGEWYRLPSGRQVRIRNEVAESLYGERVRLVVRVEDRSGNYGSDEVWIRTSDDLEVEPDAGL